MRYLSFSIICVFVIVCSVTIPISASAGDAFSDLFSQTKIYFSHIDISDGWETEVAVINPTEKRVTGNFTFYDTDGTQLGGAFPVTLNPHGRYQAEVGVTFANRGSVAYMIFSATTFGLKGYSKFYKGGVRASIMASAPQTSGLFTKLEDKGWTGIAFVNTALVDANVILTAYSDAGGKPIAIELITVRAGAKVVGPAGELFSQSIAGASYVSFSSDRGVVGFFLNGSTDNTKLDGSKAL